MKMAVLCLDVATLLENDSLGEWIPLTTFAQLEYPDRYLPSVHMTRLDVKVVTYADRDTYLGR
jgi:hypothetical protein